MNNLMNMDAFDAFPVLTTPRLHLRSIELKDADAIWQMRANNRVNEFIARPKMDNQDDAKKLVEKTLAAYKNKLAIGWAGELKNTSSIIGTCGFNNIDIPNLRAEIGGEMATEYWGKKLALEAVVAIIDFGFNNLKLHTIEAKVMPDNKSAIYVLEQLGFIKEAHFKDRIFFNSNFFDMAVYTLISK
ncbi:MAG: GNAT family N-acetyltransferase [Bacteroidota bacterium]